MEKVTLKKLISLYREKEALWNIYAPSYKWMEVKRAAFTEIAKEMGMSEAEIKKRIKTVRDNYVVQKRKMEKGKNSKTNSLWWYKEMSFLDKCIIRRGAQSTETEKMPATKPDIYDSFCNSVNSQLRDFNEKDAYVAMDKIQNLLTMLKIQTLNKEEILSNSEGEIEIDDSIAVHNDFIYNPLAEDEEENFIVEFDDIKPSSTELIENIDSVDTVVESEDKPIPNSINTVPLLIETLENEEDYVAKLQPKSTRFTTKERKFKCPICGYAGTDKYNMIQHIQRHSKNKPHKCTECDKSFHTRTELSTHMRSHTGERPFLCTMCGKSFTKSSALSMHIKRHNKDKSKQCSICQKRFYETKNLREHLKIHSDKREHQCKECNASFKQRMCLQDHMKLHENKRAYQCKLCDSKFNQRAGLYSHMKTNHSVSSTTDSLIIN